MWLQKSDIDVLIMSPFLLRDAMLARHYAMAMWQSICLFVKAGRSVVMSRDPFQIPAAAIILISGTAEARVVKLCTLVDYINCWHWDDKLPAKMGVIRLKWPSDKFWGPNHTFGMNKIRHFKFRVHLDIDEYHRMRDRSLRKEMRPASRDLFKRYNVETWTQCMEG